MHSISTRAINSLNLIISIAVLISTLYMEYALGIQPCLLCLLQRATLFIIILMLGCAIILDHKKKARIIFSSATLLASLYGAWLAAKQIFHQLQPMNAITKQDACLPTLDYLIRTMPLKQVWQLLLQHSENCAEIGWSWLGISLAGWSLIVFAYLFIATLLQFFIKPK